MKQPIESLVDTADQAADNKRTEALALASSDDIRDIERSLRQLTDEGVMFVHGQLISVADGGTGLNVIPLLRPESIRFFDSDLAQLTWFAAIVYLIRKSASRKTFIQRFFSRKMDKLPKTPAEADAYLKQAADPAILKRTLNLFDDETLTSAFESNATSLSKATFVTERSPFGIISGLSPKGNGRRRLVGLTFDANAAVPDNFECLYLNYGWLQTESVYKATRAILERAKPTFHHARLSDIPIEEWIKEHNWTYFFAGKLNGLHPEQWIDAMVSWYQTCTPMFPLNRLILMTSYDGISDVVNDPLGKLDLNRMSSAYRARSVQSPHFQAWREIVIHLRGQSFLELTPSMEIGFHEIGRDQLDYDEYLKSKANYDTVIIHRPFALGIKPSLIDDCIRKAWKDKCRIILFGHNPKSPEFFNATVELPGGVPPKKWLTLEKALKRVEKCIPKRAQVVTSQSGGFTHKDRNWFIIIDHDKIIPTRSLEKLSLKDIVGELRHETMRRFKKDLFSYIAAERFKIQDYESVIIAAREARLLAPDDLAITELFAWAMCYAGEPEAAGAAIAETARLHGGVSDEIQELAGKYGFILKSERNY